MNNFVEGSVVICGSTQSGTIVHLSGVDATVLLLNGDLWYGSIKVCREPQSKEDLDSCPRDID